MRDHGLLAHQRAGSPRGPRAHDGTITTDRVDEMWGTDMTAVATGEGQAAVFIAVDHCSAECVGIHASARATRHEALEPIRQGVRQSFGTIGADVAKGLKVRHDHGSQYMSRDFQREIRFLGAESSPAFVRAPEGNGCAERFIRTLKENLLWVPLVRHDRGAAPGAARVPDDLQRPTAHRATRPQTARRHQTRADHEHATRRISPMRCLKTVDMV
jgi:transposase InsO family protein